MKNVFCLMFVCLFVVLSFLGVAGCANNAPTVSEDEQRISTAVAGTIQAGAHAIETDNASIIAEATRTTAAVRAQETAEFSATNAARVFEARTATTVARLVSPTSRPPNTPLPTQQPPPTAPPRFKPITKKIGPIREFSRDEVFSVNLTVNDIEWSDGGSIFRPKSGFTYLIVHVRVQNLGPGTIHSLYTTDFQVKDANGALRGADFMADTRDCGLDLVDLTAGGAIEGCIGFEVPATDRLEFIYAPFQFEGLEPGRYISIVVRN